MPSTSNLTYPDRLYVWTWLPGHDQPVVAGIAEASGNLMRFGYAQSYRARPDAMSLYGPEPPLTSGWIKPLGALSMPGCLRDGTPDAWGRPPSDCR